MEHTHNYYHSFISELILCLFQRCLFNNSPYLTHTYLSRKSINLTQKLLQFSFSPHFVSTLKIRYISFIWKRNIFWRNTDIFISWFDFNTVSRSVEIIPQIHYFYRLCSKIIPRLRWKVRQSVDSCDLIHSSSQFFNSCWMKLLLYFRGSIRTVLKGNKERKNKTSTLNLVATTYRVYFPKNIYWLNTFLLCLWHQGFKLEEANKVVQAFFWKVTT